MLTDLGTAAIGLGCVLFALWCAIFIEKQFNPPRIIIWGTFFAALALSSFLASALIYPQIK